MESSHGLTEVPRSDPVHFASSQEIPSSPPSVVSEAGARRKLKKPPPVTPRSFKRFFTPRSALNSANNLGSVRTNRHALKELTSTTLNRLGPAFTKAKTSNNVGHGTLKSPFTEVTRTPSRKRKLSFSSIGSPPQSSPLRKVRLATVIHDDRTVERTLNEIDVEDVLGADSVGLKLVKKPASPKKPLRRSKALTTSGELCLRSISGRMNRFTVRSNYGSGMTS